VLDPFIDFFSVNENDNVEMRGVLRCLNMIKSKTGVAFILVHHFTKSTGDRSEGRNRLRGASSIFDGVDTVLELTGKPYSSERILKFAKLRYAADRSDIYLKRDANLVHHVVSALYTRKSGTRTIKTTHHEMPTLLYDALQRRFKNRHSILPYVFWHRFWDRKLKDWREDGYKHLNKFTVRLCKRAKVPPFNLHQLRHLAASILKDKADMSLAKLQRFLRHDHQRTTKSFNCIPSKF